MPEEEHFIETAWNIAFLKNILKSAESPKKPGQFIYYNLSIKLNYNIHVEVKVSDTLSLLICINYMLILKFLFSY